MIQERHLRVAVTSNFFILKSALIQQITVTTSRNSHGLVKRWHVSVCSAFLYTLHGSSPTHPFSPLNWPLHPPTAATSLLCFLKLKNRSRDRKENFGSWRHHFNARLLPLNVSRHMLSFTDLSTDTSLVRSIRSFDSCRMMSCFSGYAYWTTRYKCTCACRASHDTQRLKAIQPQSKSFLSNITSSKQHTPTSYWGLSTTQRFSTRIQQCKVNLRNNGVFQD